ncbi:MAG: hypothetical protein HT580_08495 [Dechloromonas sp.]|nr:MAG: hypothetical protein HT580_08495 [Dechloromonas sp.]
MLIEAVRPPAGFREIQAADLTGWDGSRDFDGMRMLIADLENFLGKPARSATAAPPEKPADQSPPYDPPTSLAAGRRRPGGSGTSDRASQPQACCWLPAPPTSPCRRGHPPSLRRKFANPRGRKAPPPASAETAPAPAAPCNPQRK